MSDSDCSNCPKQECEYRDYSYNCHVRELKEIKRSLTKEDMNKINELKQILENAFNKEQNETIRIAERELNEIIEMYEESQKLS